MTISQIRKAARTERFKPFTVSLADGRQLRVRHPECIMVPAKASRTFDVAESGAVYSIIDLPLVTSIDYRDGRKNSLRSRR